jgi:TonB family protein
MRKVRVVRLMPPRATSKPMRTTQPPKAPLRPPHLTAVRARAQVPAFRVARGTSVAPKHVAVAATPMPARCTNSSVPPTVVEEPSTPPIPAQVRALDVSGTVAVDVQLDSIGNITGASISQTTGNAAFDGIALAMARDALYSPARRACRAVASTYLFRVQFYAW